MRRRDARSPAIKWKAGPTSRWPPGAARHSACRRDLQRRRRRRAGRGPFRRRPRQSRRFLYHGRQRHRRGAGDRRPRVWRRLRHCRRDRPLADRAEARPKAPSNRTLADSISLVKCDTICVGLCQKCRIGSPEVTYDSRLADLLARCDGHIEQHNGRMVCRSRGRRQRGRGRACSNTRLQTLGWAIAQMIALVAPQIIVIGGGVLFGRRGDVFRSAAA